jgi:transmembrane protein TMEM260 (protein O-mannosyltransferase)
MLPDSLLRPATHARRPTAVASVVALPAFALAGFALAVAVFWRTAYPTITWWDSSSYSLAAATLGVESPPGSLLLTLLGWPVAHFGFDTSPAHALNLFAGVLAAIATTLVFVTSLRVLAIATKSSDAAGPATYAGAALGALTFAFTDTFWTYAVQFTPYILTPVFTGVILWTMLRWWDEADLVGAWRWLAWLGLLFGLDFSVHRTNALLIPGALAWILIRRPRTLRSPRTVAAGAGGLAAGLVVHLLLIPIAAFTRSPLNFSDPRNLSRFWDYITIKQLGGSFLLQLFPRKAPIWHTQAADLLHMLRDNFLHWSGKAGALGILPALAAVAGLVAIWRRDRRLGAALAVVLLLQALLTVLYFNIPANYFRSFGRHYLPVCVTISVYVACGLAGALEWVATLRPQRRGVVAAAVALLVALVPAVQLAANWTSHDASNRYFARDYAANALRTLPPNAIYFTVGDNDTFPVMYLQSVEGVRRDVTIINISVANIPEWPDQLHRRDPSLPLSLPLDRRHALGQRTWTDTAIVLPVIGSAEQFGLPSGTTIPDSITLDVRPVTGKTMLPVEIVLLDIVRTNRSKRPLTFAITGTKSAMEWLGAYGRLDGLFFRVVPVRDPPSDPAMLRAHLLEDAQYRGYADPSVAIDDVSRTMGMQSYGGLLGLLEADMAHGAPNECAADRESLLAKLPLDRLTPPPEYRQQIESACGVPNGKS